MTQKQGLQIFNESGLVTLDTSSSTFRYLGTVTVPAQGSTLTDERFLQLGGTPCAFPVSTSGTVNNVSDNVRLNYTVTADSIAFSANAFLTVTYIYGVI